ncbi:hypothetical protein E2C01_096706 [Portunus trituberculatus]|uniref:Uncharacterized protein n=1 Tax=Portunus trituberculatus TaxID=210409 RepID=A0A5B7K7J3_PORTR|nr:hypothetical protein [Portunus trituberculatus]
MPNEEENKAGPSQGNSGGKDTDGNNIKTLKKQRGIIKGKFTAKVRVFDDLVLQNTPAEVLSDIFSEICGLFEDKRPK